MEWINSLSIIYNCFSFNFFFDLFNKVLYFYIISFKSKEPIYSEIELFDCNVYGALKIKTGKKCEQIAFVYDDDKKYTKSVDYVSNYLKNKGINNRIFEYFDNATLYLFENRGFIKSVIAFNSETSYNIYYNDTTLDCDKRNKYYIFNIVLIKIMPITE